MIGLHATATTTTAVGLENEKSHLYHTAGILERKKYFHGFEIQTGCNFLKILKLRFRRLLNSQNLKIKILQGQEIFSYKK